MSRPIASPCHPGSRGGGASLQSGKRFDTIAMISPMDANHPPFIAIIGRLGYGRASSIWLYSLNERNDKQAILVDHGDEQVPAIVVRPTAGQRDRGHIGPVAGF